MRVTILSGSVPTTTFIDGLINAMAEEGFEMTVIGKRTGAYNYHKNVKTIIIPDGFLRRVVFIKLLILATGFKHLGRIFRHSNGWKGFYNDLLFYLPIIKSNPDRIHLQWTAFVHNRDLLFDMFPGKILVSLRGAHINYTPITTPEIKESYLRLFPMVHRFHAVGKTIAKEAEQYGVAEHKTDVIYSFVSDELLAKTIQQKPIREELHIISVGRFFWKKGYEYALDALYILKQKGVPFRYTLIAEGKTPPSIIYQLHQLGLRDHVHIKNGMAHEDVLQEIEQQDALLLPSVEEGVANVVLEAMALGTLVITTNSGGMEEAIEHNVSGFVVNVRDAQGMAEALSNVHRLSTEERFRIALAAKSVVNANHNKKTFTSKFTQFYRN